MGRMQRIIRKGLGSSIHGRVGTDKPGPKAIKESELCVAAHLSKKKKKRSINL
jgi:hypothetical protein